MNSVKICTNTKGTGDTFDEFEFELVDKESMYSIMQQFRVSDIHEWLSNIRRGKATGPDGIHNETISERKGPSGISKISTTY
jgi:hypothetical protein